MTVQELLEELVTLPRDSVVIVAKQHKEYAELCIVSRNPGLTCNIDEDTNEVTLPNDNSGATPCVILLP